MFRIALLAILVPLTLIVAGCGTAGMTPVPPHAAAPSMAPPAPMTIDGYSAKFTEYSIPRLTQQQPVAGLGPFATTIGPDGIVWFVASSVAGSLNGIGVSHLYNAGPAIPEAHYYSIATGGDGGLWLNGECCPGTEPLPPPGTFPLSFVVRLSTKGAFTDLPQGTGQEFAPTFTSIVRAPGPGFVAIYDAFNTSCECDFLAPKGPPGSLDFEFKPPFGSTQSIEAAASSPDGFVYVRVTGPPPVSYIAKIAPAPKGVVAKFEIPDDVHASAMIVGPDRNLWILESDRNAIARISTTGTDLVEFPLPTPNAGLGSIVNAPDGALYFTEPRASKIGRITMQGHISEFPTPTKDASPSGISACPNLCESAHVRLWFAEEAVNKIAKLQY